VQDTNGSEIHWQFSKGSQCEERKKLLQKETGVMARAEIVFIVANPFYSSHFMGWFFFFFNYQKFKYDSQNESCSPGYVSSSY
jgi:hypothetical protein